MSLPPRAVLIIDDSRVVRRIIRSALERERLFDAHYEAEDGNEGLEVAARVAPDVILCDLTMPNLDGFGFLRAFRAIAANRTVPVLMLSGSGESRTKVEGFGLGANDYIVKPCDPAELCARVGNYLRYKELQDTLAHKNLELERTIKQLAELAITDPLTGLHNRRHFLACVEADLGRAGANANAGAVAVLDVDHFKRINDTLGHAAGDAALVSIARTLRSSLRAEDVLARFGGEEFVVWLPESSLDAALAVAERLRTAIASTAVDGVGWPVTVSIGVSVPRATGASDDGPEHTTHALLARADRALYRSKREGRNRVSSHVGSARPSLQPLRIAS